MTERKLTAEMRSHLGEYYAHYADHKLPCVERHLLDALHDLDQADEEIAEIRRTLDRYKLANDVARFERDAIDERWEKLKAWARTEFKGHTLSVLEKMKELESGGGDAKGE